MHRVAANKFILNITFAWEHAVAITTEEDAGKLVSHRFPQFSFVGDLQPDFFRYLMLDKRFREHLALSSPGGAGRNKVLKINEMLEYKISYPCTEEQQKISQVFDELDRTITLHQRKHYRIRPNVSRNKSEPNLPHNTATWEQRKFCVVFSGLQNNTLSRADLNYEHGDIKNVHYGDVLIKFGDYIDAASAELPYINDSSIENKFTKSLLEDGDIIIADTAEDETVGKCCEITNSKGIKLLSGCILSRFVLGKNTLRNF